VKYILAIDQSTSASKAMLFDRSARLVDKVSVGHEQIYPRPGWVEHDAEEIYQNVVQAVQRLLEQNKGKQEELLCLSITNQRETIVVFDRQTGKPLHNAIVWQCRRGSEICAGLIRDGKNEIVQRKTGLPIDTYFSASKLKWLVVNHPEIQKKLIDGDALIGTIEAYLIYRLTKGVTFASDHTNACRTLLFDIKNLSWDQELCDIFDVPMRALPEIRESSAIFGETDIEGTLPSLLKICGVMGDSQGALFAQCCFEPGNAKVTFGTGSSVLLNIGSGMASSNCGIVTTIAWVHEGKPTYAFEGITNFTGATIAWLQNQLEIISDAEETEELAQSVEDNGGVYLVPAFVGLSAPYWESDAKAAILGLTPHSTKAHIAHDRSDHYRVGQLPFFLHVFGANGHHLIAGEDPPFFIHGNQSIGIPIEGQTQIGVFSHDPPSQGTRMLGATVVVDVDPIRRAKNGMHGGVKFFEEHRCDLTGGTIGTVDDKLHSSQRCSRGKATLQKPAIGGFGIIDVMNRPHPLDRLAFIIKGSIIVDQLLNGALGIIGEFVSVTVKELDAVVIKWIVGCRNDDAGMVAIGCG